jgi:hypothetical protein
MEVIINEITSRVRAVDGESALAPQTLNSIVRAVMQAIEARDDHGRRVREEQTLDNYQRYQQRQRS